MPYDDDPKVIALQRVIAFAQATDCPAFCPNLPQRPANYARDGGCGIEVCMEQIPRIAQAGLQP